MAQQVNWEELLGKIYASYTVEVNAFVETTHISKSTDVSIENIYAKIQNIPEVSSNLKLLYHESIYGTN